MGWYHPAPPPEGYDSDFGTLCWFSIFFAVFFGFLNWAITFSWIFAISIPISIIFNFIGLGSEQGDKEISDVKINGFDDIPTLLGMTGILIAVFNTISFLILLFSI